MKKPDLIAREFVRILRKWFKQKWPKTWERKWREMQRKNANPDYRLCCASHDYFDASVAMDAAMGSAGISVWRKTKPGLSIRAVVLWNRAWTIAKRDYLTKK